MMTEAMERASGLYTARTRGQFATNGNGGIWWQTVLARVSVVVALVHALHQSNNQSMLQHKQFTAKEFAIGDDDAAVVVREWLLHNASG